MSKRMRVLTETPLGNKQLVLEYLSARDLLNRETLGILMVDNDLLPLDYTSRPLINFNDTDIKRLAIQAFRGDASGVLLVEVYPGVKPWPYLDLKIKLFRTEFGLYNISLLDLLLVERGNIRSVFLSNDR